MNKLALVTLTGALIYLAGVIKYQSGLGYQTGIDANFDAEISYLLSRETVMSTEEKKRYLEASRAQHDRRNEIADQTLADGQGVQKAGIWILGIGLVLTGATMAYEGVEKLNQKPAKPRILTRDQSRPSVDAA